jgi:putative transposase
MKVCYYRHLFPNFVISYCVWLYFRFCLSYRDVQELMLHRGIEVSYESIRRWCLKFGQTIANELRHRRPRPNGKWHLDEVRLLIHGKVPWLWRAVDSEGNILDILAQTRRDKQAAKKFFRKLLKAQGHVPRVLVTDKLKSYAAAKRELMPRVEHRTHKRLNNRAENSHQPTRERERRMKQFKSAGQAQRFLSAFGIIGTHFRPGRHQIAAQTYRQLMSQRFRMWNEITLVSKAA